MSLPRIENLTDFVASPFLLVDKEGERLTVIVKATFELAPGPPRPKDGSFVVAPPGRRRGVRPADIPWGEPEVPSILYPSDLCVRKPGTDVIVVARAYAPRGTPTPSFEAGVRVGRVAKTVRVTGARVWLPGGDGTSEPLPIDALDLRYDYAFGGADFADEKAPVEDPRNPVGVGVLADLDGLENTRAPQLEDPMTPIGSASSRPPPVSLGAVGRNYEPRRKRWGTYDQAWLEGRAPLPPLDFDERANQAASPGLVSVPPFAGGEEGAIENLTPGGGTVSFRLPSLRCEIAFRQKTQDTVRLTPYLDTVILDTWSPPILRAAKKKDPEAPEPPDAPLVVELVYRAAVRAPKRMQELEVTVKELAS